ncbi:hypothetical protein WH5701_00400 [Synechococcus sp. WH 5701]|nr:hypothetical protein WH5701_00400 [Synechococcus sp. WH 5701]
MVVWSIDAVTSLGAIQQEAIRLGERWQPAPLLLLLPPDVAATREQLLSLSASGLLQNCDLATLTESIEALLTGGRFVRLETGSPSPQLETPTMGFGQWALMSGLQQISHDLQVIEAMLNPPPTQLLTSLVDEGSLSRMAQCPRFVADALGTVQLGFEDARASQTFSGFSRPPPGTPPHHLAGGKFHRCLGSDP